MTLRLNGSTSGYVEIDAPAVAGTSVLTLPTGTGTLAKETGAWTSWTPTATNYVVGNGTIFAKYVQIGKTISGIFKFTLGSTSSISGDFAFTLPVTGSTSLIQGTALFIDSGTADYLGSPVLTTTQCFVRTINAAVPYARCDAISATVPFTWTTNDTLTVSFTYEAA